MAHVRISLGPEPIMMTPGQLSLGLTPSLIPATTYIPPTDKDLEILFQPMFDEYFEQSTDSEPVPTATVVNALIVSTNTYISTMIAQDAPSTSHSLSSSQVHPLVFPQGVAAGPTIEDTSITQADLHPSVNPVAGEPGSAQSTSGDVSLAEPNQVNQPPDHLRKWTKDHPFDNIIGSPSHPVSTRKQLASDALWCCYHTVLSKVEPKNFKMLTHPQQIAKCTTISWQLVQKIVHHAWNRKIYLVAFAFSTYLDTKIEGEYLRSASLEGPYTPTSVLIAAVAAAENIPPVAAHEEAETIHNMTTENKLYFQAGG
ncbi:hypothetical protein Tco_0814678 [Tanacetum coccineum]